jgi:hypothetical protein
LLGSISYRYYNSEVIYDVYSIVTPPDPKKPSGFKAFGEAIAEIASTEQSGISYHPS